MAEALKMPEPAVELVGLEKRFGPVLACADISLTVDQGTIHGIVGENGAGKSTAMKMLFGMIRPDAGEIRVFGKPCHFRTARDAAAAGIGMVHQHFMLGEPYSVLDNIILGTQQGGFMGLRPVRRRAALKKLERLSEQYGLALDFQKSVEDLPIGFQQRVEILKLLYRDCKILILDEPTAVLSPSEVDDFFKQLVRLKDQGKTVLLITHKLKEIMAITDQVTVFRAGRVTGGRATSKTSAGELASLMMGEVLRDSPLTSGSANQSTHMQAPGADHAPTLEIRELKIGEVLQIPNLSILPGEILGIAGVEGNGQSQLIQAVLHPQDTTPKISGSVRIMGETTTAPRPWSTARIRKLGVGVLSEDRQRQGLLMSRSLSENMLLGFQDDPEFNTRGFLKPARVLEAVKDAIQRFDVRPGLPDQLASQLSGGNQQKFTVARELRRHPKFILAAHPTRGVDIGAIRIIHQQLCEAKNEGAGILLISSELEELMALSDRIVVLYRGRIQAEFQSMEFDLRKIGLAMGGMDSAQRELDS